VADIPPDARRVSVGVARLSKWIDGFADRHGAVTTTVEADQVLLTAADESRAWVDVPFPPLLIDSGRVLTSLVLHANRSRRIGVLLVRRGGYAAGVFVGRELISSKVGSSYVQGTTKAGGWSQQRFARRRDNQARASFAAAADVAARILVPEQKALDLLVLGGDHAACDAVLADPRMAAISGLPRGRFLPVPDPRLRVLQATPEQFLTLQIAVYP
jgi:hypothetical protein